jgi:hypothetical protein
MMEMLFTARARRLGKIYLGIHTVYVGKKLIKAETTYGLGRKPNLSFLPEGITKLWASTRILYLF